MKDPVAIASGAKAKLAFAVRFRVQSDGVSFVGSPVYASLVQKKIDCMRSMTIDDTRRKGMRHQMLVYRGIAIALVTLLRVFELDRKETGDPIWRH